METAIAAAVALLVGAGLGFAADRLIKGQAYKTRDEIIRAAESEAESAAKSRALEAKEDLIRRREELDAEFARKSDDLKASAGKLDRREEALEDLQKDVRLRERMVESGLEKVNETTRRIEGREEELDRQLRQMQDELFKVSGLDREAAESRLLDTLKADLAGEAGALILRHEQELKGEQERLAREIVGMAVQRYAGIHVSETTVSTVDIPNDELKGRIIGREGRNIRAFEKESGVDVIVDDTPGVVVVSSFDTVRREIARLSLQKLIQDGRIHPARIEEVLKETEKEIDAKIVQHGKEAIAELELRGVHEKLVRLMGRLQFRTSYSQNVLHHSIEVAHLTAMMAEQLGLDAQLARRCGFFHDIGKAADHELEGGHPAVGAELLKRHGENAEVVHAAAGHHDDIRPDYIYTVLVAAADAISAARPGARRESLERYVRRLEELEALALGFPGVEQVYAVQAGREVRVIVDPEQLGDREAATLARDLAQTIEDQLTYPGEVKVSVLRETRAVGIAK